MKLEDKFHNAFFYPFSIGIITSIIIVVSILFHYSNDYLDIKSAEDLFKIEKEYATINIKSVNVLIYNVLYRVQIGLQEQITLYLNIASKITDFSKSSIGKDVYNALTIENELIEDRIDYASFWFVDKNTIKLTNKTSNLYQQVSIFSQLTQSLYSVYFSMKDVLMNIYFSFDETNMFIAYPYIYFKKYGFMTEFKEKKNNPTWCTDQKGEILDYYQFKCRSVFNNMIKSKEEIFDNNSNEQPDRKIFITPPYNQFGDLNGQIIFSLCIEFNDTISKRNVYLCGDINGTNLFDSFDSFNEKLIGYFSITSIGFNSAFYFPQMSTVGYGKTLGEYIFRWDRDYFLEEKLEFISIIQKNMTSNYYTHITEKNIENNPFNIFDEIYIDDSDGEEQYFYVDGDKYNYCIFPVILEDYEKKYEHVLSIIYLFDKKLFYESMLDYQTGDFPVFILQLALFIFFGGVILYLIALSFKLLAKYIVVPIKNVQYMLEGINIGGEFRLEYLKNLKKKQEDNLKKINKINQQIIQDKKKRNNIDDLNDLKENKSENKELLGKSTMNNNIQFDKEKENEENRFSIIEKTTKNNMDTKAVCEDDKILNISTDVKYEDTDINLEYNGKLINPKIKYDKKYDLENDIIEKELNFYDFDEELLQYRPIEIDRLAKSLLNLKNALLLTSSDHEVDHIIDYSNCEYIFNNFKIEEGSRMCQSNIGNLQSQLLKYDKAIYHLALSLQNIELKKFLSQTLSDEFDENDSLLYKIEMNYNRNSKETELNELAKRQQNKKHKNFSQRIIGILINARYNKLIHIYYKFFGYIQKSNFNYEKLNGCFMHTNFHTINYYHKILIQYVYLCFVSNDLVKIGESILDYIEFLIKFKLKTSKENKIILNINNKDFPEIKQKQDIKKKYFNKILSWFNLFDNYAKQINENSALGNYKDVIDSYTQNSSSNNNEFNSGNQSAFLFQINLQRYDFLKGKFALTCENYSDAVGYLISAAKKKRIVLDGLIKKRALKHIAKIAENTKKAIIDNNYKNLNFYETFMGLNSNNTNTTKLNININNNENDSEESKDITLIEKIKIIIEHIFNDLNESNEKQLKDIIILIDCNFVNKLTFDSYIDVAKTILKSYLNNNDRIGVFLLIKENRIICPMMRKSEIDVLNFSKDLDNYSDKIFKSEKLDSSFGNEIIQERLEVDESESDKNSQKSSFSSNQLEENKENTNSFEMVIGERIKNINYCINYLKMKEINTNEKFFIYFNTNINKIMDYLMDVGDNNYLQYSSSESTEKKKIDLEKDKKINFLLVGQINSDQYESEIYKKVLLQNFGIKSEIIPFDNMKKIKSILSSNSIINDNITFPNEIYK